MPVENKDVVNKVKLLGKASIINVDLFVSIKIIKHEP